MCIQPLWSLIYRWILVNDQGSSDLICRQELALWHQTICLGETCGWDKYICEQIYRKIYFYPGQCMCPQIIAGKISVNKTFMFDLSLGTLHNSKPAASVYLHYNKFHNLHWGSTSSINCSFDGNFAWFISTNSIGLSMHLFSKDANAVCNSTNYCKIGKRINRCYTVSTSNKTNKNINLWASKYLWEISQQACILSGKHRNVQYLKSRQN